MESSTIIAFLIIGVVGVIIWFNQSKYELVTVESTVDGQRYVVRNLPDRQKAADLLATIRGKLRKIVEHLLKTFSHLPCVKRLGEKYKDEAARIMESTPDSKHTSYSVNKGEKIYFCLRQRSTQEELVEQNVMMFVSLHELSHIMTESIGHTPEFWHTFAFVLREAQKIGVYLARDFSEEPAEYCGVKITDTPKIPIDELEREEEADAETNPEPFLHDNN